MFPFARTKVLTPERVFFIFVQSIKKINLQDIFLYFIQKFILLGWLFYCIVVWFSQYNGGTYEI